jgi:hypothetical protein
LAKQDENHDGENVNRLSISTQNRCETLVQENQAYAKNNHHNEDVALVLTLMLCLSSLMDLTIAHIVLVHERTEQDENHDGENVDRPSVSAQNRCETLMQEN